MIEAFLLALALSMDAFAVSIGLGAKVPCEQETCDRRNLALKAGAFFGFFQAAMPFFGYFASLGLMEYIESVDHWVAFFLLAFIGGKMLYEGFQGGVEDELAKVSLRMMLLLSIATSIDAGAAGFTLELLEINPFITMFLIGIVTFVMSYFGVYAGARGRVWLESRAEIAGGVILIAIGTKILLEHTGMIAL